MHPKKILMGLTYYIPNISGVTQYAVILAEELVKRKHQVQVICSGNKQSSKEAINGVEVRRVNGVGVGKGFIMPYYPIESFRQVLKSEIVICHLPSVESFWLAFWGRILMRKVIIIHHCEFRFTGILSNKIIALITYPIHFLTYLFANTIVSYTKDYAKSSIFLPVFWHKVKFILPPIKIDKTDMAFDFGKGKVVGYVGRIGWEKGLQYLIEAMANIDAKLVLVGPYKQVAGDRTYEKLKKTIDNKAEFIGAVDHNDLAAVYKKLDCLVLPSTDNLETFGIVQAEAMLCGCPVVASNLPGVRVPVTFTGMGEISQIGDSTDLSTKIIKVLDKGKKFYQDRAKKLKSFDYLKTVDSFENLF